MAYQALYRVWRPQQFFDVVGQEHVTKTLQNALIQQKVSHAYLFSGPRGTGKTSAAKILAKAVNCERAPVSEPCNECAACIGITSGAISDVIEIDAASNNGVEEIRDIRDKVKYAPSAVKHKVYIIDEVHMLSIGAFNALLKTLEEPPKHVIFILATTEPHKIPLTIISRCQRYDFKQISAQAIVNRMKLIVGETGVDCEDTALQIIARAAEGGMRDALSLLDQAISFSQGRVLQEDALTVTGSVSQSYLNRLATAILERDVVAGLETLEELLYQGKDPSRFIEDFILFYRDMLLYKTASTLERSLERVLLDDDFRQIAEMFSNQQIYQLVDVLNKTQIEMRWTNHSKVLLEVTVVKLCQMEKQKTEQIQTSEIEQFLTRVEQLEQELHELKANGIAPSKETSDPIQRSVKRVARKGFQPPVGKINEILKQATKDDLIQIKNNWGEMLSKIMKSHAALLNEAEPIAASSTAFIIKFKHEIHCQMAMENNSFIQKISSVILGLSGKKLAVLGVPEEQWTAIRENFLNSHQIHEGEETEVRSEQDPHIIEAKKQFGDEFIEIVD